MRAAAEAVAVIALLLAGCSEAGSTRGVEYAQIGEGPDDEAVADAAEKALEEVEDSSYADQGYPYGCTEDCSGHDAGFEWAEKNEITDPDECGGNSLSFEEGCRARAEAYEDAVEEAENQALAELEE